MSESKTADAPPSAASAPSRLSRPASFAAVVVMMVLFQVTASAPTPLYVVYQKLWHFSSATITLIFAAFVLVLLCTLLVCGKLSDYAGRRPVLLAAVVLEIAGILIFLLAGNAAMLLAARVVQGMATGMVLPALGAALVDFNPPAAPSLATTVNGVVPIGGLALGSLISGALVQYGPAPTHLIWALLLVAMALTLIVILGLPELAPRRRGIAQSLRPRLAVPHRFRADVYALAPIIVASWALGGLYLSLGPSAAVAVFGIANHFIGGLVATLLCGTGAVAAFALRGTAPAIVSRMSVALLAAGTACTLAGALTGSVGLAIGGTVVAGVGYGASGLATFGAMATLAGPADPVERGGLFATGYTIAYLAFSLPAVAAGYATTFIGLHTTVLIYSVVVIVIALAAVFIGEASLARRRALAVRENLE
jgi:MFS family permease